MRVSFAVVKGSMSFNFNSFVCVFLFVMYENLMGLFPSCLNYLMQQSFKFLLMC